MEWNKIVEAIPQLINSVRVDYIIDNSVIRDDIFRILEKHCTVIYYPLENDDNFGFHIKKYVDDELVDFVFINTAQKMPTQVFTAAHELGHVWNVRKHLSDIIGEEVPDEMEERVVNRFAAELLMPKVAFQNTFWQYYQEFGGDKHGLKTEEIIRIMVLQMNDYMVPYEAVRKRIIEVGIVSTQNAELLENVSGKFDSIILAYSNDINTTLDSTTLRKTIPGLRDLISLREEDGLVSSYVLSKVKHDFGISDLPAGNDNISIKLERN